MGAAICGPVRLDAVSVTAYNVLSRANTSYQPACTGVSVVRDEEAAGSKSGHSGQFSRYRMLQQISTNQTMARLMGSYATLPVHRAHEEMPGTAGPVRAPRDQCLRQKARAEVRGVRGE
jgi:hypothetical protein